MNTNMMSQEQIRKAGLELLSQHLGVVGMIRFLQQSETGSGNYTVEREELLGEPSLEELFEVLEASPLNRKPNMAK